MVYVLLNIKSLLKDKLPFAWSVFLHLVMFYVEKDHMMKAEKTSSGYDKGKSIRWAKNYFNIP